MKFTVLIPLYNKAPYIDCTLSSVLAQSCRDFEIVVIDDGSTDGGDAKVEARIKALAAAANPTNPRIPTNQPQLRLVRQANAGVSVARNRGIEEARGDWVVFLDADDWQHPAFLAALELAQERYPRAQTVATDFLRFPHTEGPWPPPWELPAGTPQVERITDLPARWMQGPSLCSSAVAVRRGLLHAMQPCFPPGESVGEDLDLWFRLAERAPVALVRAPLAAYRVAVQGSLTSQGAPSSMPLFLQRLRERALTGRLSLPQRRSALRLVSHYDVTMARHALAAGRRALALRWLLQGRGAALGRRWWLTLAMAVLAPARWVSQWQSWRVQLASPVAALGSSTPPAPSGPARSMADAG
jgi:cellulose synthase/poly-beta-1,6-N-acetylglucosamine synthase-like glycosyltransferase